MKSKEIKETIHKEMVEVVRSDFSGKPINTTSMHWGTEVYFTYGTIDTVGNKYINKLDLLPEEMADFKTELNKLLQSFVNKYSPKNK